MRSFLLVPLLLAGALGQAAAQTPIHRAEVFVGGGGAYLGGDEGQIGSGPSIVSGLGFRFANKFSAEVDWLRVQGGWRNWWAKDVTDVNGVYADLLYHFSSPKSRTQPFLMVSVGVLRYRPPAERSSGVGGGVEIFLSPQLSLRPQVRFVSSATTGVQGLSAASVAAGYHW